MEQKRTILVIIQTRRSASLADSLLTLRKPQGPGQFTKTQTHGSAFGLLHEQFRVWGFGTNWNPNLYGKMTSLSICMDFGPSFTYCRGPRMGVRK